MARKRKAVAYASDSDYDDASHEPPNASEEDEEDWKPIKSARPKGRKRKGRDTPDAGYMNAPEAETSAEVAQSCLHSASLHVLSHPELPRESLLRWYGGVHASRGMPWRKPYDPSWSPEQKGQRAYEVNQPSKNIRLSFYLDIR